MAETPSKRQRSENNNYVEEVEESKRHKSNYNQILSLLDEEEDEPTQDISSLITTLQQELEDPFSLSCPTTTETDRDAVIPTIQGYPSSSSSTSSSSSSPTFLKEDDEDDKDRVIRHLLEASDDELGIPNTEIAGGVVDGFGGFVSSGNGFNGVDGFSLCDGLWEIEDANANYYALLQSELFM